MDVFQKFIIEKDSEEGDYLVLAKCTYHKQLAYNKDNVIGGGWWELDRENFVFILYGESTDFGKAEVEDIKRCVKNKQVFTSIAKAKNLTDNFIFKYRVSDNQMIDLPY